MDTIEESEETSNETTMISELLKSAEVMQQSQIMTTTTSSSSIAVGPNINGSGLLKSKEQQIQMHRQQQSYHMNSSSDERHSQPVDLPPLTAIGHNNNTSSSSNSNIIMLNQGYSNIATTVEDSNKLPQQQHHHHLQQQQQQQQPQLRHVHIPYILNGELYQIQTQDGENVTVKCCHCPPDRVYRGSVRSTGNFHMHIKRRHPDLLEKLHDMKVNALLERRDRLMRNRKMTSRSNRNRLHSPGLVVASSTPISNKDESNKMNIHDATTLSLNPVSELGMLHTHKLKIKTVFQRHQMQQREAAEMRNWNDVDYVVMPIEGVGGGKPSSTPNEQAEGPINYSLKTTETTHSSSQVASLQQQPSSEKTSTPPTNDINNIITSGQQIGNDYGSISTNNEYLYDSNLHNDYNNANGNLSSTNTQASSISPSVLSSFSSINHNNNSSNNQQYIMETVPSSTYQPYIQPQQTLSIVKPENLLIAPPEQQAIDLTLNTDSGIFSSTSINVSQTTSTVTRTPHDNRAGSHHNNHRSSSYASPTTNHPPTGILGHDFIAQKWQELLVQVETSLRDIQHEMNIRNQIESNRMFLDIAKFKFLNPGFQFNW